MKTLTIPQTAEKLDISVYSVYAYLYSGRLNGGAKARTITLDSITTYRKRRIPRYDEIVMALKRDDLTPRECDILERREQFEELADIGAAWGITKSWVGQIIKKVLDRQP